MPPTNLARPAKHIFRGTGRIVWIPTIVAADFAPTLAEINAGTDITDSVGAADGWQTSTSFVETPDAGSIIKSKITGDVTLADSSMTFYAAKSGTDIRTLLTPLLSGYMGLFYGGLTAGRLSDIYPCTVASVTVVGDLAGTNATMVKVDFALTNPPKQNFPVPAS